MVALALGAIDRHLAGRRLQALALAVLSALGRPELWPLVVVYGVHLWRVEPARRAWVIGGILAVPLLWLGGGTLGASNPLDSLQRAQAVTAIGAVLRPDEGHGASSLLETTWGLVVAPLWLTALAAVGIAARRYRQASDSARPILVLAAGALLWIGVAWAVSFFGIPALARFMIGPAAVLSVLASPGCRLREPGSARQRQFGQHGRGGMAGRVAAA